MTEVLSAHPVSDAMRGTILGVLHELETRHDVHVLYACESGSRGWGFASPDSDYDVRFIYVHRLPWYLSVDAQRDVIEQPISGELDVNGWDLRKALQLLRRSNPVLMEWLRSPIVYREDSLVMPRLRALAEAGFSALRGHHHYLAMARRNCREHLQADEVRYKKYLYVLRPLLAARWIREHGGAAPPMRFADLVQATLGRPQDAPLVAEINRLLEVKMRSGEAATSPRWTGLQAFIDSELAVALAHTPVAEAPRDDALDAFLHEVLTASPH